ncbi:hypothetical protein GWI33_005867 [Rhynchophorus ferrugineus]|uniref:Uncharacterized protein n=1 Tax=Rhynchophorus ferrugineus TaxID=354439 RepID=A0A834IID9_RHYFE|nr:hypothetical protein GWI33_005867 [Rhynchophorus ferrugineus]
MRSRNGQETWGERGWSGARKRKAFSPPLDGPRQHTRNTTFFVRLSTAMEIYRNKFSPMQTEESAKNINWRRERSAPGSVRELRGPGGRIS